MLNEIKAVTDAITRIGGVYDAINKLMDANVDTDEDALKIYEALDVAEMFAREAATKIKAAADIIRRERDFAFRAGERFFVYKTEEYNRPRELCLHAVAESSGSSWHDLKFAVGHWKRMTEIANRPDRKIKSVTKYGIGAYSPITGKLRRITKKELDEALEDYEKTCPWAKKE